MAEKAGLIERIVLRDISIIIPARHDDAALARLLALLPSLVDFDASVQLLIAAAPATESMRALARAYNAELVESEPGRGVQMNAAAAKANSKTLWFLHADAEPHARSLVAIRAALDEGAEGGYFSFTFSGPKNDARRRLAALINWRANRGVAYGDQGLFFDAEIFYDVGGFAATPLFEEVALVKAMKRRGRFRALDTPIIVDARRWESDGWIRRTLHNRLLALGYAIGISPSRLAAWYGRKRGD